MSHFMLLIKLCVIDSINFALTRLFNTALTHLMQHWKSFPPVQGLRLSLVPLEIKINYNFKINIFSSDFSVNLQVYFCCLPSPLLTPMNCFVVMNDHVPAWLLVNLCVQKASSCFLFFCRMWSIKLYVEPGLSRKATNKLLYYQSEF